MVIGSTISHYRILEKLGEGGMGVVYKAEDTKLDRPVALKFLPAHLLDNPDLRKRFEREAKSAAALDHPNIYTVHEIDDADGKIFISMALIEGESLDQKIARGPLKLDEALGIAEQVAKGLAAAHKRGIVHRDIKPENIMVGEDGHVTIMDFGLAQLTEASRLTKTDETVGTVGYMSPEQTEGSGTDHRTDVWSLGVVLYEMLTGRQPFHGDYSQAVMYSILNEDPEPMTALRTGVPMGLELVTRKCLAKKAEERYHACTELLTDLKGLAHAGGPGAATVAGLTVAQGRARPPAGRRPAWAHWGFHAFAFVAIGVLAYQALDRPDRTNEALHLSITPPEGTTFPSMRGPGGRPELSPDGRRIVFQASGEDFSTSLFVRELSEAEPTKIPNTEGGALPFWSPDSQSIAFYADGRLKRLDLETGAAIALAESSLGRGGTWGRDPKTGEETIVFSRHNSSGLLAISATGGEPRPVTMLDVSRGHESHRAPHFLPDGRRFLYIARARFMPEHFGIYLGSIDVGSKDEELVSGPMLVRADAGVSYAPPAGGQRSGYLLYDYQDALMAHPFDAERLVLLGEPVPVVQPIESPGAYGIGAFSASSSGLLVYRPAEGANTQPTWFDRDGNRLGTVGEPGFYRDLDLSPDGRKLAVTVIGGAKGNDIAIFDLESDAEPVRLTFDEGPSNYPTWSPDSRFIAYALEEDGKLEIYVRAADGGGTAEPLGAESAIPSDWSPSDLLFYEEMVPGSAWDVGALEVETGKKTRYLQGALNEGSARLSPNERWLAFTGELEGGSLRILVRPFPDVTEGVWEASGGESGSLPVWRADGQELFFLSGGQPLTVMSARVLEANVFRSATPEALFSFARGDVSPDIGAKLYDVTRDGEKFIVLSAVQTVSTQTYEIVVNWQELLP